MFFSALILNLFKFSMPLSFSSSLLISYFCIYFCVTFLKIVLIYFFHRKFLHLIILANQENLKQSLEKLQKRNVNMTRFH